MPDEPTYTQNQTNPAEELVNQFRQQANPQQQQPTPPPTEPTVEDPNLQKEMLAALVAQGKYLENLQSQVQNIVEAQKTGSNYVANLEQGQIPATPAGQGQLDWDTMSQSEIVSAVNHMNQVRLAGVVNQFGEMLETLVPEWDGWKMREAIYGLMNRGLPFKQAYEAVKKVALESKSGTGAAPEQATAGGQNSPDFKAAVEKRAQELLAQQRSVRAGAAAKPARNDATAQTLTPRELNTQLYRKIMEQGEEIPTNLTRGL